MRSERNRWLTVFALAAVGTACAGHAGDLPDHEGTTSTQEAITNGASDDADPAAVALLFDGQIYCSGVLITSNVVATAGHCLTTRPDAVYFGVDPASMQGTFIKVNETLIHPQFNEDTLTNDIGLVGLVSAAPVAPVGMVDGPLDTSLVGLPVRLVGFGSTRPAESPSRKRSGTTTIVSYAATDFRFHPGPSQTCNGDSGGPAFATIGSREVLVGLTSSGDEDCKQFGTDTRVDTQLAFISGFSAAYSARINTFTATGGGGCSIAPKERSSGPSCGSLLFAVACALVRRSRVNRTRRARARRNNTPARP